MNCCTTPLGIEILLHYVVSPSPFPRLHASACREMAEELFRAGLLSFDMTERRYSATTAGVVHICQLCAIPFPRPAWIGANGQEIRP